MKRTLVTFLLASSFVNVFGQWTQTAHVPAVGPLNHMQVVGSTIFVGSSCNQGTARMIRSTDQGQNWEVVMEGLPDFSVFGTIFSNETRIFVSSSYNPGIGIYMTEDNGDNWIPSNNGISNDAFVSTIYQDGNTLFASANGTIYRSQDNGDSWQESGTGIPNTNVQSFIRKGPKLFAGTNDGVYKSVDNGYTWVESSQGLPGGLFPGIGGCIVYELATIGPNILAGTYSNGMYISSDDGAHWTFAHPDHVNAFLVHGTYVYASFYGVPHISSDNGLTWINIQDSSIQSVRTFGILEDFLYAGTSGSCEIWRRPLSELEVESDPVSSLTLENTNRCSFSISPNPFWNWTDIKFETAISNGELKVFDVLGQEMVTVQFTGDHVRLSNQNLISGVYLVTIRDSGMILGTQRVMID